MEPADMVRSLEIRQATEIMRRLHEYEYGPRESPATEVIDLTSDRYNLVQILSVTFYGLNSF